MSEYEFGQAVMARAGVGPYKRWYVGNPGSGESCYTADNEFKCRKWKAEHREYCIERAYGVYAWYIYPDPLTSAGFDALWDALVAKNWHVHIDSRRKPLRYAVTLIEQQETWKSGGGLSDDRKAALLEAAAAALGVVRS